MNEISNFCTGDLCRLKPETESEVPTLPSSRQEGLGKDPQWVCHLECWEAQGLNSTQAGWAHPPYDIANGLARSPLGYKAGPSCYSLWEGGRLGSQSSPSLSACLMEEVVCCSSKQVTSVFLAPVSATHFNPISMRLLTGQVMSVLNSHHDGSSEYNAHQLYSLAQTRVTAAAVESIRRKRPFILSRHEGVGFEGVCISPEMPTVRPPERRWRMNLVAAPVLRRSSGPTTVQECSPGLYCYNPDCAVPLHKLFLHSARTHPPMQVLLPGGGGLRRALDRRQRRHLGPAGKVHRRCPQHRPGWHRHG